MARFWQAVHMAEWENPISLPGFLQANALGVYYLCSTGLTDWKGTRLSMVVRSRSLHVQAVCVRLHSWANRS